VRSDLFISISKPDQPFI